MWYVVPWLGGIKFKSSAKIEDKNGDAIMKFAKKCPKDQTMDAINARVIRIKIDTRTHPSYNNNSNNNKDNDGNGDRKSPHEHIRSIIISWSNWYERPFEWEQQRERRKKDDLNDDAILCWKNSLHFCYVCWKVKRPTSCNVISLCRFLSFVKHLPSLRSIALKVPTSDQIRFFTSSYFQMEIETWTQP